MQMPKICFLFIILLLMIAQPVVFANNDLNKEETQKATIEFVNFFSYRFNNLQNQITDVTQKNLELEAKLEELQKQLVSNKEQITALTQENLELKAKLEKLPKQEAKLEELQKQLVSNTELEKVKEKVQKQLDELKNSISIMIKILRIIKEVVLSEK